MFLPETPASPSPLYMNLLLSVLNHAENIHLLTPHHNIWVGVCLYDIFPAAGPMSCVRRKSVSSLRQHSSILTLYPL